MAGFCVMVEYVMYGWASLGDGHNLLEIVDALIDSTYTSFMKVLYHDAEYRVNAAYKAAIPGLYFWAKQYIRRIVTENGNLLSLKKTHSDRRRESLVWMVYPQ